MVLLPGDGVQIHSAMVYFSSDCSCCAILQGLGREAVRYAVFVAVVCGGFCVSDAVGRQASALSFAADSGDVDTNRYTDR